MSPTSTPGIRESRPDMMHMAEVARVTLNGSMIPPWDYCALTYVGSTNNVATATFKRGGASGKTVCKLTMTYVADGVANDDEVATVTRSQS